MPHNLRQLQAELKAAGVDVPALGSYTDPSGATVLHTYSPDGAAIPLPAAAVKVLKAHQPQPTAHESALAALRASDSADTRNLLLVLGLA